MNSTELLKILGIEMEQNEVTEVPRAKKRRLDHLSWDEKIQRKKLKNRVAAQTSRDRKKARIEQMESAITELCTRNETLMSQCENLKNVNVQLSLENAELKARLMEPCLSCKQNRSVGPVSDEGSSDGVKHTSSSGFDQNTNIPENSSSVPSLPELLDELDRDIDFESLEQLAESLLKDIAKDLENDAEETDCQVSKLDESERHESSSPVVGQTSEELESTRSTVLNTANEKSVHNDISQYLLLHHNYTKPGPDPRELTRPKKKYKKESKSPRNHPKLKKIIPKIPVRILSPSDLHFQKESVKELLSYEPLIECKPIVKLESSIENLESKVQNAPSPTVIKCEPIECSPNVNFDSSFENTDIIYGTYDEATNSVTIVINEDGTNVTESEEIVLTPENVVPSKSVKSFSNVLELPFSKICNGGISPMSCSGSDGGYESLGSPSHCENEWLEMSELFPTLL